MHRNVNDGELQLFVLAPDAIPRSLVTSIPPHQPLSHGPLTLTLSWKGDLVPHLPCQRFSIVLILADPSLSPFASDLSIRIRWGMLERASSSAECTAILISKAFERPVRTRRVLNPEFWHHRPNPSDLPVWWPIYLHSIRKKSAAQPIPADDPSPSSRLRINGQRPPSASSARHVRAARTRAAKYHQLHPQPPALSVSRSAAFHQEAIATLPKTEISSLEQAGLHSTGLAYKTESDQHATTRDAAHEHVNHSMPYDLEQEGSHPSERTDAITAVNSTVENDKDVFEKTWDLYTQSGQKYDLAAGVLGILAQSRNSITLTRALVAYDAIRPEARTQTDFDSAADVATRLRQYPVAIEIIKDAVRQDLGGDALFKFVSYCVDKELWMTIARLWRSVGKNRIERVKRVDRFKKSESFKWAGKFSPHFEHIKRFPDKVVDLAKRLANNDPVLAARRQDLSIICTKLALAAAQSPNVMQSITTDTCLALLGVHKQLDNHENVHLAALNTLNQIRGRGHASQLAFRIYQDYKLHKQNSKVPRSVFGILINVARDDCQPPSIYDFIMDELKKTWGEVDEWSFQQVLAALASQGEIKALHDVFDVYMDRYQPKSLRDVVHLLHVHAVSGDSVGTQTQFDHIKHRFGFTHNVVSWTILLLAHARSPHPDTAFEVFKNMQSANITPNHMSWSILMSVAARRGDIDRVQGLYAEATALKIHSSAHMIGAVVEAFLLNDKPQEAESWVVRATERSSDNNTVRLWNSLFRYYAFKADSTAIYRLQRSIKKYGIVPDSMTYAALMTLLVVQKRTMDACRVLRNLYRTTSIRPYEFHYSILIHGFVMEAKQDMANLIYQEMLERFPKPTPSARLAMLYLRLQRNKDATKSLIDARSVPNPKLHSNGGVLQRHPRYATDQVSEMLLYDPAVEAATMGPSPGFGRMTPRDGLEAIFLSRIIRFLQARGEALRSPSAYEDPNDLLSNARISPGLKIETLASMMSRRIVHKDWEAVDTLWNSILSIGKSTATPLAKTLHTMATDPALPLTELPMPISGSNSANDGKILKSSPAPAGNIGLIGGGREENFTTMLPRHFNLDETVTKILPARRFMLSKPLSLYMQTLGDQARHHDLIRLVRDIRTVGFQLNNQNCNKYIQILARSSDSHHQLLAFKIFEKSMMPYAPGWKLTKRGLWAVPRHFQSKRTKYQFFLPGVHQRRRIERLHPSINMPSYFTMVHLAAALTEIRKLSLQGKEDFEQILKKKARRTMKLILRMPYSADRVQGLLLRDRDLRGKWEARAKSGGTPEQIESAETDCPPLDTVPAGLLISRASHEQIGTSTRTQERHAQVEAWKGAAVVETQRYTKLIAAQHPRLSTREVRSLARKHQKDEYHRRKRRSSQFSRRSSPRSSRASKTYRTVRHRPNIQLRKSLRDAIAWRTFENLKRSS